MKDHSELKRLAETATPGPWVAQHPNAGQRGSEVASGNGLNQVCADLGPSNALYIAAANPTVVLALVAEVEALRKDRTDWQAECLKRGFEYVRESDDHYVLADIPEMAELLGLLLGVEVRSKDSDSYGETVSMLQDMADANSDAFHRAYELEKENEYLKKDAARYRWLRQYDFDIGSYHPEGDFSHESWFERFDDQSIDRMIAEEIAFEEEDIIEANNK